MIGVATPEYQLSFGNGGEFVDRLESVILTSGQIVSLYTRGNLGGVVQMFDPATGLTTNKALLFVSSAS